ncbi:hypothetical protein BD410DRAFT_785159 [Rickenella mellea]|uniref:DUF6533 domain-containing protein n=1 Tax=Rickenella mellea TaxID=50990 RepID=A0A4Y7QC74_9AGAM|nr:hypothetical protein BD410DRAFT_785159 [Rickenella mellea]
MASDLPILPHEIVEAFIQIRVMKSIVLAEFAVLVWDYFVVLPEEVALIWPARWTGSKCLFMINRYLVFVDPVMYIYVAMIGTDAHRCETTFRTLSYFSTIGFLVAQSILMLRTYAVWGTGINKSSACMFGIWLAMTAIALWTISKYLGGFHSTGAAVPGMSGCAMFFANRLVWVSVALYVITETVLVILLVYKAAQHFRFGRSSLMMVIYRDGLWYFACILVTSIANLAVVLLAPVILHLFLLGTQRVMHSILCTRILLHIREADQSRRLPCLDTLSEFEVSPNSRGIYSNEELDGSTDLRRFHSIVTA